VELGFLLKIVWNSLGRFKLRALLTLLGIFLGSFSLAGVNQATLIMQEKTRQEVEKLGNNLLLLTNAQVRFRPSGGARLGKEAKTLKLREVTYLASLFPQVIRFSPFARRTMPVKYAKDKVSCQLLGVWPGYLQVRKLSLVQGRFLTDLDMQEKAMVCVLGAKIASRLFGKQNPVGKVVYFFRAPVKVVGVLAPKGSDIAGNDQDEQVFVPLSTYLRRLSNQDWISGAYFNLSSSTFEDYVKQEMEKILTRLHKLQPQEEKDFSLLAAKDLQKLQQQALDLVKTLGLISSLLSFGVGSIGILSIMILLVRTRKREIALKRACGARKKDILVQFLLESSLLSSVGGFLGILLVVLLVLLGVAFKFYPLVLAPWSLGGTFLLACMLGFVAGLYPAWEASNLEILTILKEE
jgi:putative ABC transport system permease protein